MWRFHCRKMKRVRAVVMSLLLAVLATYIVAWCCSRWPGTSNSRGLSKGEAWTIVQDRLTLPPSKSQTASGTETHGRGWKHIFANVTQRPVDGDGGSSNTV